MSISTYIRERGRDIIFSDEDPKINTNPASEDILWINKRTGELFYCVDNSYNRNVWHGSKGTVIGPFTISKFDIFEDGSAVALWRFENNFNEDGGVYNGIPRGTVPFEDGRFGLGARINGGNWIEIPSSIDSLFSFGRSWTVSVWAKYYSFEYYSRVIDLSSKFIIGNRASTNLIFMRHAPNYPSSNTGVLLVMSEPWILDEFVNFIISYDAAADEYRAWKNGIRITYDTLTSTSTPDNPTYGFGKSSWTSDGYLNGTIDQIRILNRAINDDEARVIYNEISGG